MKELTTGALALRRSVQQTERLQIVRERLELLREKHRAKTSPPKSNVPASGASASHKASAAASSGSRSLHESEDSESPFRASGGDLRIQPGKTTQPLFSESGGGSIFTVKNKRNILETSVAALFEEAVSSPLAHPAESNLERLLAC